MKKYLSYLLILLIIIIVFTNVLSNKSYDIGKVENSLVYIEVLSGNTVSSGSGFVYKSKENKNYIITCFHILQDYENIYVYGLGDKKTNAIVVGYDTNSDIAVLEIDDVLSLKESKLGNSNNLRIGDEVYALGTPIDYRYFSTFTKGIISYLNREIKIDNKNYKTIQVDMSINNGNSGGPLVNEKGNVVGMVFIKEVDIDGVAFALPINYVMEKVDKILIR